MLQAGGVGVVESRKLFGIGIKHAPHFAVTVGKRDDDFRLRARGAGDVVGVGIDIGYHQRGALLPCLSAHAAAVGNAGAGQRPLERPQHQIVVAHQIKAHPQPAEGFFEHGGGVGKIGG